MTNAINKTCQTCCMYFNQLLSFWGVWGCAFNIYFDVKIKSLNAKTKLSEQAMNVSLFKLNHFYNNMASEFFIGVSKFGSPYLTTYISKGLTVFVQAMHISIKSYPMRDKLFLSMKIKYFVVQVEVFLLTPHGRKKNNVRNNYKDFCGQAMTF